ncbi:MAG: helix-turn-helix domain-containing protein [Treponema sp.]|jgi:predicted XRE-type DNA-binding protein|nr:helix-turn-helix domain-containing protein [Treponema sp.]
MRGKRIKIALSSTVRSDLEKYSKTGKHRVRLVNRAKIILGLDEADGRAPLTQSRIAEKLGVARQTVNDAKRAFIAAESASEFLRRKKRETPPVEPKIAGEMEAQSSLARAPVARVYAKRSVRQLADKCVELLHYIDSISFKPVQRVLKKHHSNRA